MSTKRFLQLLILVFLCAARAAAAITVTQLGVTNTQAVLQISGAVGPCTIAVSLSNTHTPVIRDVDPMFYANSNVDTSRADTITWADGTRIVTIGHAVNDRALFAATPYYWLVSGCGSASGTFTTDNIPPGFTQSFPFLSNSANWGNRATSYSIADLLAKTPVADPMTGAKLTPIAGLDEVTGRYPGAGPGAASFSYWSGGTGWTNPSSVLSGPASTASTSNGNPLDLYVTWLQDRTMSGGYYNQYFQNALVDMGVKVFGSGTHLKYCIFTNPTDGCSPNNVDMTGSSGYAQVASAGADPDHVFPPSFPSAYFSGWPTGTRIGHQNRHTGGTMAAVGGLVTIDGVVDYYSAFMVSAIKAGNKVYVDPAGITSGSCPNNLCTIASVISAKQVQLVEAINANTGTHYEALGWGVRIQNDDVGTTMRVGLEWKMANTRQVLNGSTDTTVCPPGGAFTSGGSPTHPLRVCAMPPNREWYLVSDDGVGSKPLWAGLIPPDSYFTSTLGWNANDIPVCSNLLYCGVAPKDARTWYVFGTNRAGSTSLWTIQYRGDGTEDRRWGYTRQSAGDPYQQCGTSLFTWPCTDTAPDKLTWDMQHWEVVTGYSSPLIDKIMAFDPTYDQAFFGSNFSLQGVTESAAYFLNQYGGGQNTASYIAILDTNTNLVTHLMNTGSGKGLETAGGLYLGGGYGGVHNVSTYPALDTPVMTVSNWGLGTDYLRTITSATRTSPMTITDPGHGFAIGSHPILHFWGGDANLFWYMTLSMHYTTVIDADTISVEVTDVDPTTFGEFIPNSFFYSSLAPHNVTYTTKMGGPWLLTPDAILRCNDPGYTSGACSSSAWNSDLSLDWPIGSGNTCVDNVQLGDRCRPPGDWFNKALTVPEAVTTCPAGGPYEAYGARNDTCITLRVPHGGFCNSQPAAAELAHPGWVCPWNSGYSHPWSPMPGQSFQILGGNGQYGEKFKIIAISEGTEAGGMDKWIVQRNASGDVCVAPGPPYPGGNSTLCSSNPTQNQFPFTWTALAMSAGAYGNAIGEFLVHGKSNPTIQSLPVGEFSHGSLAAGPTAGTYFFGSAEAFTDMAPIDNLFPVPPSSVNVTGPPKFHGTALSVGGGIQSYFALVPHSSYGIDVNLFGDNFGGGQWDAGTSLSPRDATHLTGDVYKIEGYGTFSKYFFPFGEAGGNNFQDVSGTATAVSGATAALSTTPYAFCDPLKANECYAGSSPTEVGSHGGHIVYVNVPGFYDPTHAGMVSQHWANSPWVISGQPGAGAIRQQDMSHADFSGSKSRQISYVMDIPGLTRTYGSATSITEGVTASSSTLTNGVLIHPWLINTPPYPAGTTSVANDVIPKTVTFPPGPAWARLRYGYSRIMGPDSPASAFLCATRTEACNSGGDPFVYDSETPTVTSDCAGGCSRTINFQAPNVAFYQMQRSSDGVTWSDTTDGTTASEITPLIDSGLRVGACGTLTYAPTTASYTTAGGSGSITVTADSECTSVHSSSQTWLTLSAGAGCTLDGETVTCTGSGTVNYAVDANVGSIRSALVLPDSGTASLVVSQDGTAGCTFSISPTSANFAAAGESKSIDITASDPGCAWTATGGAGWLTVGTSSGTGSATINAIAAANVGSSRSTAATIAGRSFSAIQGAGSPTPGRQVTGISGRGISIR